MNNYDYIITKIGKIVIIRKNNINNYYKKIDNKLYELNKKYYEKTGQTHENFIDLTQKNIELLKELKEELINQGKMTLNDFEKLNMIEEYIYNINKQEKISNKNSRNLSKGFINYLIPIVITTFIIGFAIGITVIIIY